MSHEDDVRKTRRILLDFNGRQGGKRNAQEAARGSFYDEAATMSSDEWKRLRDFRGWEKAHFPGSDDFTGYVSTDSPKAKVILDCFPVGARVRVWTGSEYYTGPIIARRCHACCQFSLVLVKPRDKTLAPVAPCLNGCEPKPGTDACPEW